MIKIKLPVFLVAAMLLYPLVCETAHGSALTPEASQMYEKYSPAILQVREIVRGSREKSGLGSGFFFTADGLVATNYHVVADAVNYPKLFSVEYIMPDGQTGEMEILNIDPVHDLAILKVKSTPKQFLELGDSKLEKGMKIFSFGNPHDLGLIIIEGLFNGLLDHSRYPKILFSGSLNAGMSGGPAVRSDGKVLGVNVSTAGNEISFFVPVEYLQKLYEELQAQQNKTMGPKWDKVITKRLVAEGEQLIGGIVASKWAKSRIGTAQVPGQISDVFRCWGSSSDNQKFWMIGSHLDCATEDGIYLSSTLGSGMISFNYSWYESRDKNSIRFYNLYESYEAHDRFESNSEAERDLSNFVCEQEFVNIDGQSCKVEICGRRYKEYDGLYDLTMRVTSTDLWTKGLMINVFIAGFTEVQGKQFLLKFLKEIQWQK